LFLYWPPACLPLFLRIPRLPQPITAVSRASHRDAVIFLSLLSRKYPTAAAKANVTQTAQKNAAKRNVTRTAIKSVNKDIFGVPQKELC